MHLRMSQPQCSSRAHLVVQGVDVKSLWAAWQEAREAFAMQCAHCRVSSQAPRPCCSTRRQRGH
jgi:hypothetical protein